MKILFLTPQLPYPPRQGTTIRNFNLIMHLAQRHTIDLLTFLAPGEQLGGGQPAAYASAASVEAVQQPVRPTSRRAAIRCYPARPDMGLRLESPAMHANVGAWTVQTETYDIVQIEGIELAQYGMRVAGHATHVPQRPRSEQVRPRLGLRRPQLRVSCCSSATPSPICASRALAGGRLQPGPVAETAPL